MQYPLFSVVIPAYNASYFIRNTLDSVRFQTFDDYEIIIVNDGSRDDTLEVVKAYFTDFPNLSYKLINQENKGIGAARNIGIKEAKGEFVAFLDADDKWYKNKLLKVKSYLEENSDIDFICHDEYWIEDGSIIKKVTYGPYKTYKELLLKGNCISTSATVVSKNKLLEAGLFSENLDFNGVEDYELWLRLSKICKIGYLHKPLGEYHIHHAGITNNIEKHTRNTQNVIEFHLKQWPQNSIYYKYRKSKRRADVLRGGGRDFVKVGNFHTATSYLGRSLLLNPLSAKTWILLGACLTKIKL